MLGYYRIKHSEYETIASAKCQNDPQFQKEHEEAYHDPIMTSSQVYDLQQNHEIWFDARVNFLCELSKKIIHDSNRKKDYRILDSGMGPGIDIAFLANKFPYMEFEGYDIQEAMVEKGLEFQDKLSLTNLSLFVQDNSRIDTRQHKKFDLIYNNVALIPKNADPVDSIDEAISICQMSKDCGLFIVSGLSHRTKTKEFSQGLEDANIPLRYSKKYSKCNGNQNKMLVYQVVR